MAALTVQSLAAVGSSSHGPNLVCNKGLSLKRVLGGNILKNRVAIGQKPTLLKSGHCTRLNCRGSNESNDAKSQSENIDISELLLNSSDIDLLAMPKVSMRSSSESATRPPKFTTLRPFGEAGAGVMSGLEGSLFELLAANIEATADLKRSDFISLLPETFLELVYLRFSYGYMSMIHCCVYYSCSKYLFTYFFIIFSTAAAISLDAAGFLVDASSQWLMSLHVPG